MFDNFAGKWTTTDKNPLEKINYPDWLTKEEYVVGSKEMQSAEFQISYSGL